MADEFDASQVVMRRVREVAARNKLDFGLDLVDNEGKKKVKWSDSTELREKMKEYRRSQLSICLDYQHIAVEEEREREGVKMWRETKDKLENHEEEEEDVAAAAAAAAAAETGASAEEDANDKDGDDDDDGGIGGEDYDSDDDDPYCDETLEAKLRAIKAKASRHTLLPAYVAAVGTYESWLESDSSSTVSQDEKVKMTSQLDLYRQIVDLYSQWSDEDEVGTIDKTYRSVLLKVIEAKKLGDPPQAVNDSIDSVLNNEANIKKHKETYSFMVDDMVTDLSKQIQTTTL